MKIKRSDLLTAILAGLILLVVSKLADQILAHRRAALTWLTESASAVVSAMTAQIVMPLWIPLALVLISCLMLLARLRDRLAKRESSDDIEA